MKLNSASASALLLLLVPLAAFADVTNGLVLQTNNALNLDTGAKVAAGAGDLLWNGSSLVPQGKATAVTLGALGISAYNSLTEAALIGSKSAATSAPIPSSSCRPPRSLRWSRIPASPRGWSALIRPTLSCPDWRAPTRPIR